MPQRSFRLFLLLLALLPAALLAGCKDAPKVTTTPEGRLVLGAVESADSLTRSVSPGARVLVLKGFDGDIRLTGSDNPSANLVFVRHARAESQAEAAAILADITVSETGADLEYTYAIASKRPELSWVEVHGTVPRQVSLRIELTSGSVNISDVQGVLKVQTRRGDIALGGATSGVTASSESGDVLLGAGMVLPEFPITLRTSNGDIRAAFPGGSSVLLEAHTQNGRILTHGLPFTAPELSLKGAGGRFKGKLGEAAGRISLQTQNGDIYMSEQAPVQPRPVAPPADSAAAPGPAAVRPDSGGQGPAAFDSL